MTVAELIAELQKLPQDAVVLQARDPEGNSFPKVDDISTGRWDGEDQLLIETLTDELRERGYTEEDVGTGPVAVCLWPAD